MRSSTLGKKIQKQSFIRISGYGLAGNMNEVIFGVLQNIARLVFEAQGLQESRSEYDMGSRGPAFWIEHSPGTEENWIDVTLIIEKDDEGLFCLIEMVSLDEDFPFRSRKELTFSNDSDFDKIVWRISDIMDEELKRAGK